MSILSEVRYLDLNLGSSKVDIISMKDDRLYMQILCLSSHVIVFSYLPPLRFHCHPLALQFTIQ